MQARTLFATLSALPAVVAVLAAGPVFAQAKSVDDIVVANVNGEEITRRQLVARLIEYQGDDALDKMINRSLVLQAAKKLAVTVTEAEVDTKVQEIRKQFKNDDDFQAVLTRSNLTPKQHRDEVRFTLLLQKVALKESPITDEDLQLYNIRMIIAPDKKTGEGWVKELDGGSDFGQMASQRSLDPAGKMAQGKMRPFLKVEMLDIWRAISEQGLKAGQFTKTPVLLTDNNWAIIKLEEITPSAKQSGVERERATTLITRYRMDIWLTQARNLAKITKPVPLAAVAGDKN
jgi:parvulin-like peptidyl-prolyl isomerase